MKVYPWLKRALFFSLLLFVLYQLGPYLAGALKVGDREGPMIYDEGSHSLKYNDAHEMIYGSKARVTIDLVFSERPYFYGLSRRPKPKEEREKILKQYAHNSLIIRQRLQQVHEAMGE